uniref:Uncharacterized protein n=1 Tax=Astyanax mexicanus TaxID=7994 RepID=A0A3B1IG34_ASTMX
MRLSYLRTPLTESLAFLCSNSTSVSNSLTYMLSKKNTNICETLDKKKKKKNIFIYPGLQFLDLLLATLHGDLLSFIQTMLQVLDGLLHVLLHALQVSTGSIIQLQLGILLSGLVSAASLRLQRALQGVHHSLLVPLGLLHLLIFFNQFALNISLHLVELQLSSQDLSFFMLKGTL